MIKRIPFIQGMAWLIVLFVLPLPFLVTFSSGLPSIYASKALPYMLGVIAYVWMPFAIYVGTKPKWLDRLIGMPYAYMMHGIISILAIALAFLHKENSQSSGLIKLTGDYAFTIFLSLALYSLIFMAGWLTSRVKLLQLIKKGLEKLFKHELSLWLHRLNLIATLLVFIHVQLIDYVVANTPFMAMFWLTSLFVAVAYIRSFLNLKRSNVTGHLVKNQLIADNVRELVISVSRRAHLKLQSGDYIFISFPEISGMTEPHPFSLVNDPKTENQFVLTIRGDGDFTKQLSQVAIDSKVLVDGGFSLFQSVIRKNKAKELVMIGGGIGIVPLLSIAEGNPDIPTQLFYSVKKEQDFLYQEKIAQWNQRPQFRGQLQVGRYSDDYILSHLPEDKTNLVVLLGGPISMGRHWKSFFLDQGLHADQIYFEEFSW